METITLNFKASGQILTADANPQMYASNTVNYIQAVFDLDDNWKSFDSVRAVWHNEFACISMVLDGSGACAVPHEVLSNLDEVQVNLVGSVVDGDELTDRMTTYPLQVAVIDADALICGTETAEVTPSQFEQFIAQVAELVGSVRDIDRIELNDDYTLTVYFSDETSWTSTSIRGEQGETGNGIASAVLNDDYTLTLTFTDGTSYTTSSIRGEQGPQGEPGEVTLAQLESVLPTDTASGAIASFPDGSDLFDYLSCVVNIEPVQAGSGTPSPDNVRPITGWTGCEVDVSGVNVWDEEWELGYWSNGVKASSSSNIRSTNKIPIMPETTYYFQISDTIYYTYYDIEGNFLSLSGYDSSGRYSKNTSGTITTPTGAHYMTFNMPSSYGTTYKNDISINYPSTDTPYHAYNPNSAVYPVSWQTEAGTVYGGTVDLVTGVLTVDRAGVDLGAIDYAMFSSGFSRSRFRTTALETLIKKPPNNNTPVEAISSMFDLVNWGAGNSTDVVGVFGVDTDGDLSVWLNASDYSDATAFKTAMSGQKVVYKLAQAQTYQLDPVQVACLLGQNNVWADCGDVEVQYKADVQRWVEKMLNA